MKRSILTTVFFSGLAVATVSQAYITLPQQAGVTGDSIRESFERDLSRVSAAIYYAAAKDSYVVLQGGVRQALEQLSPRVGSDAVLASFVRDLERDGLNQGNTIDLEQRTSLSASDAVLNSFVRDLARN
jgi:hypothetical protein